MQQQKSELIGQNSKISIDESLENGLRTMHVQEPMKLSEWAEENFYLSPESSSISGAWENIPYQIGIMDCISNDDIRTITWKKSARVGYTKIIVAAIGYFAEHKKRSQVVYQPTDSDAEDFVKDEIDPMIRDVPVVRNIFPYYGKKNKTNTLSKKVFKGSTLDVLGGTSSRNYRRLTKDVAILDELDGFVNDVGGEGSATSLSDARLTTSSFPKSIRGSTPRIKETSQITASLNEADVVLRYHVPCPHCDEMQYLKWGGDKAAFGMRWKDNNPATAHYCCEHCNGSFEYRILSELLEKGQWRSEDGVALENELFYQEGKIIDAPEHVGFELWAAYSIFYSWSQLVAEYLRAVKDSKEGQIGKLKSFVNTRLGECWEEDPTEKTNPDNLYNRREHYDAQVPDGVLYLVCGVDTQDDRFEYIVKGYGLHEESWDIDFVRLYGDLSRGQIWATLAEMLRKTYKRRDGSELSIDTVCIDSGGHYTDEVYGFSKKNGLRWIIPIKGSSYPGKPIATFPRKKTAKGVYLTEVGTDNAKNTIYQRLNILEPGPGYFHFPINESFDEDYFNQLVSENKKLSFSRGRKTFVWVLPKGRRNESLDCNVYALAALRIAKQHKGINLEHLHSILLSQKANIELKKTKFNRTRFKF